MFALQSTVTLPMLRHVLHVLTSLLQTLPGKISTTSQSQSPLYIVRKYTKSHNLQQCTSNL